MEKAAPLGAREEAERRTGFPKVSAAHTGHRDTLSCWGWISREERTTQTLGMEPTGQTGTREAHRGDWPDSDARLPAPSGAAQTPAAQRGTGLGPPDVASPAAQHSRMALSPNASACLHSPNEKQLCLWKRAIFVPRLLPAPLACKQNGGCSLGEQKGTTEPISMPLGMVPQSAHQGTTDTAPSHQGRLWGEDLCVSQQGEPTRAGEALQGQKHRVLMSRRLGDTSTEVHPSTSGLLHKALWPPQHYQVRSVLGASHR